MQPVSVQAIFCEDIREEKRGTLTLVGLLPDNINVAGAATTAAAGEAMDLASSPLLIKICIYLRINFDPDFNIGAPRIRLILPDAEEVDLGRVDADTVTKAQRQARERSNPLAGLVTRVVLGPLPKLAMGQARVEVLINDQWWLAGAINFRQATEESTTSST